MVAAASLNIRGGPGAEHPKVAPALKRGTELILLEAQDRWSRVAVVGVTDLEGWVSNDFVERQAVPRSGPSALHRSQRQVPAMRARPRARTAANAARKAPAKARTIRQR